MSNGAQTSAKKGLPVWAWIGIGCGGLVVFAMIVLTIGSLFAVRKGKEVMADFEKDPAMTIARGIVKASPELEEVSSDPENGTMTIRNKKNGEVITVDFDDIKSGQFSFKTGDREVNIDASDLEGGNLKVTDGEGEVVYSAGKVSEEVPDWVPLPEGSEPTNRHLMKVGDETSGKYEIETALSVAEVLEFFKTSLEAEGYEVAVNTYSANDTDGGVVNGSNANAGRNVVAIVNSEGGGPTKVVINFSER